MTAKYILRFDDITETMNHQIWKQVVDILKNYNIKPLLAVVPENQDPKLNVQGKDPDFWKNIHYYQHELSWSVALHGHRHLYTTNEKGKYGTQSKSEFAGLSYNEQKEKISSSISLFKKHNIIPQGFIAPGHSFDNTTIQVLKDCEILMISDGYSLHPYTDTNGIFWLPQQLWRIRNIPIGVWTICYHTNSWTNKDVDTFEHQIKRYSSQIASVDEMTTLYKDRKYSFIDAVFERIWPILLKIKK